VIKDIDIKLKGFRNKYDFVSLFMKATAMKDPETTNQEYSRYNPMNWLIFSGEKRMLRLMMRGGEPINFEDSRRITAMKYPRLTALVISASQGYATPSVAAMILEDVQNKQENGCEWLDACWRSQPIDMLRHVIKNRHYLVKSNNPYNSYKRAKAHVARYINSGVENEFAAWF
jgi:hypothetical protein